MTPQEQPDSQDEHICTGGTWNNTTKQFECKHIPVDSQAGDELDVYVQLFEAGKELSRQYEKYDGDKDWIEWLAETIPKTAIPGVPNSGISSILNTYAERLATKRAIVELQLMKAVFNDAHIDRAVDGRIKELEATLTKEKHV